MAGKATVPAPGADAEPGRRVMAPKLASDESQGLILAEAVNAAEARALAEAVCRWTEEAENLAISADPLREVLMQGLLSALGSTSRHLAEVTAELAHSLAAMSVRDGDGVTRASGRRRRDRRRAIRPGRQHLPGNGYERERPAAPPRHRRALARGGGGGADSRKRESHAAAAP